MDRVMTGRKLNAFARLAFQRYFIKGNLTNVCFFIESSSSGKCKLCGNWLLRSFWPFPLFRYKKMSVKETSFFTMCHYSEFHQTTYVNFRRNDLQNDVRFSLGKCFPATQETLQNSTRKTWNHAICRLRDQRVKEHSCLRNDFGSNSRTFSETNNIVIPSFVKLLFRLSFEACFCRDILPLFCLVQLFTSASNGIRLKTLLVSRIRILSFCPLFNFLCVLTRAF